MSIRGVEVTATFDGELTEDQVEQVYTSFDNNFAIKSVDMFTDFEKNEISFLFGVETLDLTDDSEEQAAGIVDDALHAAFQAFGDSAAQPELSESLVGSFV